MAGSEDATYLMNRVRACGGKASYMALGTTIKAPHHNDLFDVNEEDMMSGVKLLLGIVYNKLS
jgi:aminobenzoyl-glutamate utilization protein A